MNEEINKINWNNLFKGVYANSYNHLFKCKSLSNHCLFFNDKNEPFQFDVKSAILIQQRIMKYMYDNGWRFGKNSYLDMIDEICRLSDRACNMGPLDLNVDEDYEIYFNFDKFLDPLQ